MGHRFFSLFFMQVSLLCTAFTLPVTVFAQEYSVQEFNIFSFPKDHKRLKKYVKELKKSAEKGEEEVFKCLRKIIHFAEKRFEVKFSSDDMFVYLEGSGIYIPMEWRKVFKDHYRYYVKKKKAEIEFASTCYLTESFDYERQEEYVSQWLAKNGVEKPKEDMPLKVMLGVSECLAGGFLMFCGSVGVVFGPWSATLLGIGSSVMMHGFCLLTDEYIEQQEEYDFTDV